MENVEYHPKWQKGIYPNPKELQNALNNNELFVCNGREEVSGCITRYVEYYNSKRPSWALNYDTPDNYYKRFINGEIERKETFKNRILSEIPKGRKKHSKSTFENEIIF